MSLPAGTQEQQETNNSCSLSKSMRFKWHRRQSPDSVLVPFIFFPSSQMLSLKQPWSISIHSPTLRPFSEPCFVCWASWTLKTCRKPGTIDPDYFEKITGISGCFKWKSKEMRSGLGLCGQDCGLITQQQTCLTSLASMTVPTPTVRAMVGTLERSLPKKRAFARMVSFANVFTLVLETRLEPGSLNAMWPSGPMPTETFP